MVIREAHGGMSGTPAVCSQDAAPMRDLAGEPPMRDPPPYPAHLAQFYTPGYRQSYSGSEASTDMSLSSNENLSSTTRQDPQGEETVNHAPSPGPHQSGGSEAVYGSLPASPGVEAKTGTSGTFYISGNRSPVGCAHPDMLISNAINSQYLNCLPFTSPSSSYVDATTGTTQFISCGTPDIYSMPFFTPNCMAPSVYSDSSTTSLCAAPSNGRYVTAAYTPGLYTLPLATCPSVTKDKGLASKALASTPVNIKNRTNQKLSVPKLKLSHSYPPPEYPGHKRTLPGNPEDKPEFRRSFELRERVALTSSQPDLTQTTGSVSLGQLPTKESLTSGAETETKKEQSRSPTFPKPQELDHAAIATKATQMVERLSEENRLLRKELEIYCGKVSKLQKVEEEIQKVQGAYECLVKHSTKRENLEKIMRFKMDDKIRKTSETNKELKDQLDKALQQMQEKEIYNLSDSELKKELTNKDSTIAKLIAQNKEVTGAKERLDIEVAAQRSTLAEQRSHIEVLDNALTNAHANIMRIEEQLRLHQGQDAKVAELENAVAQLQRTSEKREAIESRLRARLEDQLKTLRAEKAGISVNRSCDADEGISSDTESPTSSQGILQEPQDKEARILQLEAEVLKWEQRYLEENALRQLAVDAASMPKDARIAALEQSSLETEKIIADARHERLQHLEEVYQANRKAAELEAQVKSSRAHLAEKDAMIKVLQRHSSLSRCSSISSLLGSPIHSSRPSFMMSPSPEGSCPSLSPLHTSLSLSSPPSGVPSRQNSQIDTNALYAGDAYMPAHTKSSSTGTPSHVSSSVATSRHTESQVRLLQQKLAAQAALYHSLQSGQEELSKCLWQV